MMVLSFLRGQTQNQNLPTLFILWSHRRVPYLVKNGPTSAPFCLFSLFWFFFTKNCWFQQDSNTDRRTGRWARWPLGYHHGPSVPYLRTASNWFKPVQACWIAERMKMLGLNSPFKGSSRFSGRKKIKNPFVVDDRPFSSNRSVRFFL